MNAKQVILDVIDVVQELIVALNCKEISLNQAQELTERLQQAKIDINTEMSEIVM